MILDELKRPLPSKELALFHLLQNRTHLTKHDYLRFNQLDKGFKGEKIFYERLKQKLPSPALLINNLTLSYEDSPFQIDSLLVSDNDIYLFEIKNYYGDFYIKDDQWFNVKSQNEIRNPSLQLNRTRYLFQKTLQNQNMDYTIHPYLIFINDEFTLYNTQIDNQLILPSQLNRFLNHLSQLSFNPRNDHKKIIEFITANHKENPSFLNLPEYTLEQLKKGTICKVCQQYLIKYNNKSLFCNHCQVIVNTETTIVNSVEEYSFLFPNKKITTKIIVEWCGGIISSKAIQRVLRKYYKKVGITNGTHYIKDENNQNYKAILNKVEIYPK